MNSYDELKAEMDTIQQPINRRSFITALSVLVMFPSILWATGYRNRQILVKDGWLLKEEDI
jgi:hypothetical protein